MNVRDLTGDISKWKMTSGNTAAAKSKLHLSARELLHTLFSTAQILEEVTIHPKRGLSLYLDFYLPLYKLCVEVQGEQHYVYNSHFFRTKQEWHVAIRKDGTKKQWCFDNGIEVIDFPYNEDQNEWTSRIQNR